jgi:phosphatidylserine/phosphatidylglycerophosphate/cardiolipin synthase-like enzyme
LLACYDDVVACICEEMDRTAAGDRVEFSVYVLEPGESTERVLRSMRRAARRGVRVDCSLDCSVISQFTRWCEGTETWADRLTALAAEFPGVVTFAPRRVPTHAKYVMCHRVGSTSTAVFGGVNIGDRFRDWRDFAIRAEGADAVGALAVSVNGAVDERTHLPEREKRDGGAPVSVSVSTLVGRVQTSASRLQSRASRLSRKVRRTIASRSVGSRYRDARSDAAARAAGVGFVSNRPSGFDVVAWAAPWWRTFPGRFDVLPALEALMADERYDSYRVAAAYVDGAGVNVLEAALRRLVDEDAKRAEGGGSRGRLRAYVCDDMLHAKVFLATSSRRLAPDAAMVGSCNLKRRSFGQFAELNALITQARCTKQLGEEMEKLVRDSEEVTSGSEALVFEEPRATVEEWLG